MIIKVIIIGEDKQFNEYVSILLKPSKMFNITGSFTNPTEALEQITTNPPDVAITELCLPDISGPDFIKKIKVCSKATDVLVLTSLDGKKHIFSAIKAGAVGYLLNSDRPEDIIKAVSDIFKGYSPMSGKISRRVLEHFHINGQAKKKNKNDLTNRELDVLETIATGRSQMQTSKDLDITYECVRSHLKKIYRKLNVNKMNEAINVGRAKGLIKDLI